MPLGGILAIFHVRNMGNSLIATPNPKFQKKNLNSFYLNFIMLTHETSVYYLKEAKTLKMSFFAH